MGRDVNGSAVPALVAGGATYSPLAVSKWSGWVCGIRADDQTLECFGEPARLSCHLVGAK